MSAFTALQITVRFALLDDQLSKDDLELLHKDGASEAQVCTS